MTFQLGDLVEYIGDRNYQVVEIFPLNQVEIKSFRSEHTILVSSSDLVLVERKEREHWSK